MKRRNRLNNCVRYGICYPGGWNLVTIMVLGFILLLAPTGSMSLAAKHLPSAQEAFSGQEAIAAQQKKADEFIDLASAQLNRRQYQDCLETISRCRELEGILSSSQKQRLDRYAQEAENGLDILNRANQALNTGIEHLQANRLMEAKKQFDTAMALRKNLPADTVGQIEAQLDAIKSLQKEQKEQEWEKN